MKTVFHCDRCKRNLHHDAPHTTGYGVDYDNADKICFECCGDLDRQRMAEAKPGDKYTLYLSWENETPQPYGRTGWLYTLGAHVSNWPGTLRFGVSDVKKGRHNFARWRYDVWFKDHTGAWWHGVQYGDNTQLCHCRKLKHPVV